MNATLTVMNNKTWEKYTVYNRAVTDFRLDEQLDTGSVMTITDSPEPIPPMSMAVLSFSGHENTSSMPAYCFDTVEIRGQGYCAHTLTLVEPTRRLMGILIDGVKVTQPQDESEKDSLYTVIERLLKTYLLLKWYTTSGFSVTTETEIVTILRNTTAPEFAWEAETQLWECLKDIGNVINCIPRLTFNAEKTDFNVITFDKINDVTAEREL